MANTSIVEFRAAHVAHAIANSGKAGRNYAELVAETGFDYQSCVVAVNYLHRHGGIAGKPIRRDTDPTAAHGRTRRFWAASQAVETSPHLAYRVGTISSHARTAAAVLDDVEASFGLPDVAWMRLKIDVERLVQDLALLTVPSP